MKEKCNFVVVLVLIYSVIDRVNSECKLPPFSCVNGGTCDDTSCLCVTGFTGNNCEINIDECAQNSDACLNGGSCVDGVNSFTCDCVQGYTGDNCQINIDDCAPNPNVCLHGGTCKDGVNEFTCDCVPGYTGDRCEIDIDECAQNPCLHGGSCVDGVNGFTCDCDQGYTGGNCEINIDECAQNPCLHGGSCVDGVNGFTCDCDQGYSGGNCEINIDECAQNPCLHGGSCVDGVNGFTCDCVQGYTGGNCEINIDECAQNPCLHGGSCVDGINGFTWCNCVQGYAGGNCEINIDECALNPCLHGGSCVDGVNGFTCDCDQGYTGGNCEINIDECAQNPCLHGCSCFDGVYGFICDWVQGYTVGNCAININECAQNPCLHGGSCVDGINGFACDCVQGYTGGNCEINIDECALLPTGCLNGGTCIDGIGEFTCNCANGFTGDICQTFICDGETVTGTCESRGDRYKKCKIGYKSKMITDVHVTEVLSMTTCEYFEGKAKDYGGTGGVYGFKNKHLWVDKGCRLEAEVCLEDRACDTSSSDDCNDLDLGDDDSEDPRVYPGWLRKIALFHRFLVDPSSVALELPSVYETEKGKLEIQLSRFLRKKIKAFYWTAPKIIRLWKGSLNIEYTIETDNVAEALAEVMSAILALASGQETIEIFGQNVSAASISINGLTVTTPVTDDTACEMYSTLTDGCPAEQECVVRNSMPDCQSVEQESHGIQQKLLYVIIALCVGAVTCIVVLVIVIAVVRWNRQSKGVYKVEPRPEPMRILVEEKKQPI